MAVSSPLASVLDALERHGGPAAPPPLRGAFEMILWENVAYLADDERRLETFRRLRKEVGTTPSAILAADTGTLRDVTGQAGILPDQAAGKLLRAAEIARQADPDAAVGLSEKEAIRVLRRFPGIGEPGAQKILLFCGRAPVLALESNGLRALVRLGYGKEAKSYAATYRSAQAAA